MDEVEKQSSPFRNRREVEIPIGYIEIFSRTGKIKRRIPVRQMGLRLGRSYDNDIILDDPYICPHHASFQWEEGKLVVRDLGSINGLIAENQSNRVKIIQLASGDRVRVGRTILRFCGADLPVAKTLVERSLLRPLKFIEHPLSLTFIYFCMMTYAALNFYLDSSIKFDSLKFAFSMLVVAAAIIVWSAFWAFASRLILHRWNFLIHCGIACLGLIAFSFLEVFSSYVCFAFGVDYILPLFGSVGYALLTALLIYFQLRYVSHVAPFQLLKASIGIAVTIVGLLVGINYLEQQNYNAFPRYSVTLKSPAFKLVESNSSELFFNLSDDFKKSVDNGARLDK